MIPPEALILLDTNILVHLVRWKSLGQKIDAEYQLRARDERPLVSIITVGELYSLAKKWSWGAGKRGKLEELVREFPVVNINSNLVLHQYAELDVLTESAGRKMKQNDLWSTWRTGATRGVTRPSPSMRCRSRAASRSRPAAPRSTCRR